MFFIFWNLCDINATDHAQKSVLHEVQLGDFWAWSVAFISHKFQKMKNNTYIYIQYHFYVKLLCIRYFSPLKLMYSPGSVFIERNWPAVLYRKLEENVVPFFYLKYYYEITFLYSFFVSRWKELLTQGIWYTDL